MSFANENVAADMKPAVGAGAATPVTIKKTPRRGISSARGTVRLKFSHEQAHQSGLFLAHLENVELRTIHIGKESVGMPSFNDMDVPQLVFTFASNDENPTNRRFVTLSFNAVESTSDSIPGHKDEWKVNNVFDWLNHLLNVFVLKGREFTDEEAEKLGLDYEDFDENGDYVPVDPQEVLKSWTKVFENVVRMFNQTDVEDGTPVYKSKDGKFVRTWIKLVRYVRSNKKGWVPVVKSEDLAFPTFVGEGCVELFKNNTLPVIRLDVLKERIYPMKLETAKQPNFNAAQALAGGAMGGVPIGDPMTAGNTAFGNNLGMEAADDMPF